MTYRNGGIQLPDDVVNKGYKQTRPFHYEQVFYSEKHNFTGTEKEFIQHGLEYGYRDWETDRKSTRLNSSHSGEARMPSSA